MTMIGHNVIAGVDPLTTSQSMLELLREDAQRWKNDTPTAETAGMVRDAIDAAVKLASSADRHRDAEKRPFLEGGRAVDEKWRPVIDDAKAIADELRKAIKRFMDAEREAARRAAEEERARAEEERRKAAEAVAAAAKPTVDEDDPFAEYEAQEKAAAAAKAAAEAEAAAREKMRAAEGKVRVASLESGARALSTRKTYEVEVTDGVALVTHFANHPEIVEACRKLAAAQVRAAKGHAAIPGIVVHVEEKVV